MLKEVVLLYDIMSAEDRKKIEDSCLSLEAELKIVRPGEYRVPLGFLCYGTEEQKQDYLTDDGLHPAPERPMLVLAGFTNQRIRLFLDEMKKNKAPRIALKAVLTEYNALWDSLALYEELKKEDEYMTGSSSRMSNN